MTTETTTLQVTEILRRTEKAIEVVTLHNKRQGWGKWTMWLPLSQVISQREIFEGKQVLIEVPNWLADSKARDINRISDHTIFNT